jgi:uncharacterized membrane protein YbhN (UPF0104 family)
VTLEDDDEHERPQRHLWSNLFNLAMLVVGGAALWWMIRTVGVVDVVKAVTGVGRWFGVILALDLIALGCDSAALHAFMRPEARMVSYWRVLAAQASGRAINAVTPGGALGEATKLSLLTAHAPRSRVLSSLVLLNLTQLYLAVIVIVIGTPIMFMLVDIPHTLRVLIMIGLGAMIPLIAALAVIVKRGATTTIVAMARRIHLISRERAESWKPRVDEVDHHIRELQKNRSYGTWKGILWIGASKVATSTATICVLHATAGVPVTLALVVAVLSAGVLVQWVAQIVPMGLGLAEGGNYALFDLVGVGGDLAVPVTMINRARSLLVAMLGLVVFAAMHALDRLALARVHRKLERLRARAAAR